MKKKQLAERWYFMNSYKKMLKVTKAVLNYSSENIVDCEIIYINEVKHLKINYKDKESLFIQLEEE